MFGKCVKQNQHANLMLIQKIRLLQRAVEIRNLLLEGKDFVYQYLAEQPIAVATIRLLWMGACV